MGYRDANASGMATAAPNAAKAPLGEELDFLFRAIDAIEKEIAALIEQVAHVTREHPPLAATTAGVNKAKAPVEAPEPYRSHSVESLRVQRKRIIDLTDRLNDVRTRLDV